MDDTPNEHHGHEPLAEDNAGLQMGDSNGGHNHQSHGSAADDNAIAYYENIGHRSGHQYSGNIANDNARVQNGDQYYRYGRVDAVYYGNVSKARSIASNSDSILSLGKCMVESMVISRGSILSPTRLIAESKNGEALIDAASKGQIKRMQRLLVERYTNIDFVNRNKMTPLLSAVENGQSAAVTTLLQRGANPGLRDNKRHKTHLVIAAEMGKFDIFSVLLQHGAPTDGLQVGRGRGEREAWWYMIENHGERAYKFDEDEYCASRDDGIVDILAIAISCSKPTIVAELLEHGLQPHKEAISAAIVLNDAEVIQSLAAAGADAEMLYEIRHMTDCRPLHVAAYAGLVNSVHGLITAGADINAGNWHNYTPLHCAAENNHEEVIRTLITAGANIEARDNGGWTPLMTAAPSDCMEALQVLLAAGADTDAQGDSAESALHLAACRDETRSIKTLLAAGAGFETRDSDGSTPLHFAAQGGCARSVQILLAAGADLEARNEHNQTPLHLAASTLSLEGAQAVLVAGANASAVDDKRLIPYDLALKRDPDDHYSYPYVVNDGKDKEKVLALLESHMEQDDFDSRSFMTARTRQNLEADEITTIGPTSNDEDEENGDNDEDAGLGVSMQDALTIWNDT